MVDRSTSFWRDFEGAPADDANWSDAFAEVLDNTSYKDGYGLLLAKDKRDPLGRWYFQVQCVRPDSYTSQLGLGRGGKGYLSPHMTVSELTRLLLGLFLSYEEHEAREFFRWRGRAVYGPHIQVEALHRIADELDVRG
jgi:hypothetical protein